MKTIKCNHDIPIKGKPNRYITNEYLMCAKCKKKLRKLTDTEKKYINKDGSWKEEL